MPPFPARPSHASPFKTSSLLLCLAAGSGGTGGPDDPAPGCTLRSRMCGLWCRVFLMLWARSAPWKVLTELLVSWGYLGVLGELQPSSLPHGTRAKKGGT